MSCKSKISKSADINFVLANIQADLREIKENIMTNKNEIKENKKILLDTIGRQNNGVCEVLAEHSVCLKSIISSFWNTPKFIKQFPIKSEESLLKWEEDINQENKDAMVKTVTAIMGEKG